MTDSYDSYACIDHEHGDGRDELRAAARTQRLDAQRVVFRFVRRCRGALRHELVRGLHRRWLQLQVSFMLQFVAMCCSGLQCVAVCC